MANFILGTRGSLLAVTQSTLIKNQLEILFPEHEFVLKTIKTQGDLITDKPLWQLEGKDFFTRELDDALLNKEVDFVVHSYKDLSTTRPDEIYLAAITKRTFANDIMLIQKSTIQKLCNKEIIKFNIGTSSPRRQFLLKSEINELLPYGKNLDINFLNLRGNINTRISKLNDGLYDAICLAAAGLDRLASNSISSQELKELTKNLDFKILPLTLFPSAPAQGALAIECLNSSTKIKSLLKCLNCAQTANEVIEEKNVFQKFGGGCHLALGVMCKQITPEIKIMIARGEVNGNAIKYEKINSSDCAKYFNNIDDNTLAFTGLQKKRHEELKLGKNFISDEHKIIENLPNKEFILNENQFPYFTSEHTIEFIKSIKNSNFPVWCSGTALHKKISQLGYWVNGDNESLGSKMLITILESNLGKFLWNNRQPLELTFSNKKESIFQTLGVYTSKFDSKFNSNNFHENLSKCNYFYWTSKSQFDYYQNTYREIIDNKNVKHFCGLGKTYNYFKSNTKINITPLPNINVFIQNFLNSI